MALPASRRGVHPDMVDRNGNIKFPKDIPEYGASDAGKNLSVKTGGTGLEWKEQTKELPSRTVADAGKVLTIEADGTLGWEEKQGGGAVFQVPTNPTNTGVTLNNSLSSPFFITHSNGRLWVIDLGEDSGIKSVAVIGTCTYTNTMYAAFCDAGDNFGSNTPTYSLASRSYSRKFQFCITSDVPHRFLVIGNDYNNSAEGATMNAKVYEVKEES